MSTKQPNVSIDSAGLVSAKDQETNMRPIEIMARAMLTAIAEDRKWGYITPDVVDAIWQSHEREAKAALQALEDAGFRIVPYDATDDMYRAGKSAEGSMYTKWKAMLEAAPNIK